MRWEWEAARRPRRVVVFIALGLNEYEINLKEEEKRRTEIGEIRAERLLI